MRRARRGRRRSRRARSPRRSCAARAAPPACAPGRPSPRPRRPPAAGRRPGSRAARARRATSRRQPEVEQVGGAEVDRDREVEAVAPALADLLQRAVEHERRQRAAEPAVVGERQEVGRHQQPAARVRPAHERLDAAHRARRDLRLRLVVQDELAVREPVAQLAEQLEPAAASGGRARAGRPRGRCACAWPRTSPRRRAAAARARRRACSGKSAMPMRRVDVHADPADRERALQRRAQPQAGGADADASSPGSSTTANSSPPSRASVSPGCSASSSRGPIWRQHLVAGVVAERVVELLEAVEVDQQQRDLAVAVARSPPRARASRWRRLPSPVRSSVTACRWLSAQPVDDRQPGPRHAGQDGDRRQRRRRPAGG